MSQCTSDGSARPTRRVLGVELLAFRAVEVDALLGELGEPDLRSSAEMLDDFACGQGAEARAAIKRLALCKAGQKTGGEQIAGAGGIDQIVDRGRRNLIGFLSSDNDSAFFRSRDRRQNFLLSQGDDGRV